MWSGEEREERGDLRREEQALVRSMKLHGGFVTRAGGDECLPAQGDWVSYCRGVRGTLSLRRGRRRWGECVLVTKCSLLCVVCG